MIINRASSCYCCSPTTSTILIGSMFTGVSFLSLYFQTKLDSPILSQIILRQQEESITNEDAIQGLHTILHFFRYTIPISIVLWASLLVLSIVLIYGAVKENPRLVVPWIVWAMLTLVFNMVIFIVSIALLSHYGITSYPNEAIVTVTISGGIFAWNIMIVTSFYRKLLGPRSATMIDAYHPLEEKKLQMQEDFLNNTLPKYNC